MTAIVILNVVFSVLVVGGILALLGRAIVVDRSTNLATSHGTRRAASRPSRAPIRRRPQSVLDRA